MNHTVKIILVLLVLLFSFGLTACEDEKEPIIHWKVFRENIDGDYTMWTMPTEPELDDGFVCWTDDKGNKIKISGKITIQSFVAGEK